MGSARQPVLRYAISIRRLRRLLDGYSGRTGEGVNGRGRDERKGITNAKSREGYPAAFRIVAIRRRFAPPTGLLDLGFLELDMLAHDGIVLREGELLRLGTGILLGDVAA
jgi:hypothetical protein